MRIIAGQARGRHLRAPRGLQTRPATARIRASIFSRLGSRAELAAMRVLDLYAGSGSLGIEALSRGAAHAVMVDSSASAAAVLRHNLEALGLENRARVIKRGVMAALAQLADAGERFDLVFVDAPYADDRSEEVVARLMQLELLAIPAWVVVRQSARAGALSAPGLEPVSMASFGGHRIAVLGYPASIRSADASQS